MEAPSCLAALRIGGQWARTLVVLRSAPKTPRSRSNSSWRVGSPVSSSISRTRGTGQAPTVLRMLPMCSSMWLIRMPSTTWWGVIAGIPVRTVPLLSRSASPSERTTAAAALTPFSCRARVSALEHPAKSLACLAFISSSMPGVKLGIDWPEAIVFTIPEIGSWPLATWCAVTPTGHFSAAVTFFQSASLSFSIAAVVSCTFVSYCLANPSTLAPMIFSLVYGCDVECTAAPTAFSTFDGRAGAGDSARQSCRPTVILHPLIEWPSPKSTGGRSSFLHPFLPLVSDCETWPLVPDCLVHAGPEVQADTRRLGGGPVALGQQDPHHLFPGVRIPRGAEAAVPAEAARRRRHVVAPGDHGQAESPAVAVEVAADQARGRLLLARELIGRHGLDGGPRQDALASVRPLVQHHLAKGQIVVDGRDQARGGRRKRRRATPLTARGLVEHLEHSGLEIGPIAGGEPIERRGGDAEARVLHAEGREDALAQERVQGL